MGLLLKKRKTKTPSKTFKSLKGLPYAGKLMARLRLVAEKDDPALEAGNAKNYISGLLKPGGGQTQVDADLRELWSLLDEVSRGNKNSLRIMRKVLTLP